MPFNMDRECREYQEYQEYKNHRDKILIVDDSAFNRKVLSGMLCRQYDLEEAEDAEQALVTLSMRGHEFSLVLLDLVMPGMGGFGLLERMNRYQWISSLPVIMVSSETESSMVKRAYSLGITDFIRRPYEEEIVRQRIKNTLKLYEKQRRMMVAVAEKYYENERNSNLMISILSNVVEFRNGESGPHILHIKKISWFLFQQVLKRAGPQNYTEGDIHMLCKAAALHDIGKIAIPDEILNKPGRLTEEEYEIMKTHSRIGANILKDLPVDTEEPLVKAAYEICRWHHERWDGGGYPDGLKEDEIPMHAQVVALADVYDALTSERCYKEAYSHEKAIQMILDGECGAFNPVLLECLQDVEQELRAMGTSAIPEEMIYDPKGLLSNMGNRDDMAMTRDLVHRTAVAQAKVAFLKDHITEPSFFYCCEPSVLYFSAKAQRVFGVKEKYVEPQQDEDLMKAMGYTQSRRLLAKMYAVSRDEGDYPLKADILCGGEACQCSLCCRNIWLLDPPALCGIIGIVSREDGLPFPENT